MLIHFNDLFVVEDDKIVLPKVIVKIEDIIITPKGFPPLHEIVIDGVPLQQLVEELLEVDLDYQNVVVFVVKGIAK